MDNSALLEHLCQQERELQNAQTRGDAARLRVLLHKDFREHGYSGRSYNLDSILALLLAEDEPTNIHPQDFVLQMLAENVALLIYRSAHRDKEGKLFRHSLRSSVWQRTEIGWQMIFHQGTPTAEFAEN